MARAAQWANCQPDVPTVVVVGSYAYGHPRMESDVDLVVLSSRAPEQLADLASIQRITPRGRVIRREQWGPMNERRVRLASGLVVEIGLTAPEWAALPLDPGTATVLSDECKIVVDDGTVTAALQSIGRPVADWQPLN
ncbi:MAG: nucleotidyltransferase domain-containing protein [Actinomycetota bacterium]|nr:nucleotidyltransferase domain-containing protein [Actinomycetota bacterium]